MDQDLASALAELTARGLRHCGAQALAGDLSTRRYYRLQLLPESTLTETYPTSKSSSRGADPASVILALYPSDSRSVARRFAITTELLTATGIVVPAILAQAADDSWMVVSDLGPLTVFQLPAAAAARGRDLALAHLSRIATLDPHLVAGLNPPLDATLLRRELAQTETLLLATETRFADHRAALSKVFDQLVGALAALPAIPCHRDLMVRNLVQLDDATVAVLDHQDLRLGPPTYDLASLLNDSIFVTAAEEPEMLAHYLPRNVAPVDYHRAAAQRTLKAVGSFLSAARRGISQHLPLVAPTLAAASRHLQLLPEAHTLSAGALGQLALYPGPEALLLH